MRLSETIKIGFGLQILALSLISCKGTTKTIQQRTTEGSSKTELPRMIEYNRDWSLEYAVDEPNANCGAESESCHNGISNSLREKESAFTHTFLAGFQAEPTCSGISIHPFGGGRAPQYAAQEAARQNAVHWELYVDFDPRRSEQSWRMTISPGDAHPVSGEDNAHSMAHTVCSVVKEVGGTVVE